MRPQKIQTSSVKVKVVSLLPLAFCLASFLLPSDSLTAAQVQKNTEQKIADETPSASEANRLYQRGIQQYQAGEQAAALQAWQQALSLYRTINDHRGEATVLLVLGDGYEILSRSDQTQVAQAIAYYEQARPIFQQIADRQGEAYALLGLGNIYLSLAELEKAINYYQRVLPIFQQIADRQSEATVLNNLGYAHYRRSKYGEAIQYYEQARPIFQQIADRQGEASVRIGLGNAHEAQAQYDKAVGDYNQALFISQQAHDRSGEAKALNGLGDVYQSLNQFAKAMSYYQLALPLYQQLKDRSGEAKVLNGLGGVYQSLDQFARAISSYHLALPLYHQLADRNGEAKVLNNLGIVSAFSSQFEKAIAYYKQALPIFQQLADRQGEANVFNNLGQTHYRQLKDSEAITYYEQALPIFQQLADRQGEGVLLSNLGDLFARRHDPELAIVFYKQSVNVRETIRIEIRKLPRASQEAYTQSVASTYRSLADLLIQQGRFPEAQAVLELLKLRELKDFTRDIGIDSPGINLAKIEAAALEQLLQRYTTVGAFSQKIAACEQTRCLELQQLQAQRDKLNQAVNIELKQQRAVLTKHFSTESASLAPEKLNAEARRIVNAQPGTVLIYPLILKDKIQFLLAIKAGDGAVTFRPFETDTSAETLFKTIQTFRQQLQSSDNLAALQATSQQLYTWLIKPLEPELNHPAIKHLVFAPDSTTRYIPLAALFDGNHYLVERYSISTITAASTTDTTEIFAKLPVNASFLLAVGASTFTNANPLDNVPAELNAIVKLPNNRNPQGIYPGMELLNTQFDFDALKANLKGHRILHIATHGKFQPGRPEDSYLLPGRGQKLTTALIDQLGSYGLSDIHLVVLSACETAVGDRASDGIEIPGISYFFLKNEVKAVMASLWSVNDASTSLMMQQFYQQLATGKRTKAEALQLVQQQFITGKFMTNEAPSRATLMVKGNPQTRQSTNGEFSHPFYWAPFILIGNSL